MSREIDLCLKCPLLFCDRAALACLIRKAEYEVQLAWRRRNRDKVREYNRRQYEKNKAMGRKPKPISPERKRAYYLRSRLTVENG